MRRSLFQDCYYVTPLTKFWPVIIDVRNIDSHTHFCRELRDPCVLRKNSYGVGTDGFPIQDGSRLDNASCAVDGKPVNKYTMYLWMLTFLGNSGIVVTVRNWIYPLSQSQRARTLVIYAGSSRTVPSRSIWYLLLITSYYLINYLLSIVFDSFERVHNVSIWSFITVSSLGSINKKHNQLHLA